MAIPYCRETWEGDCCSPPRAQCLSCYREFPTTGEGAYPFCPWCGVKFLGVRPSSEREAFRARLPGSRWWQRENWKIVARTQMHGTFEEGRRSGREDRADVLRWFRREAAEFRAWRLRGLWGWVFLDLVRDVYGEGPRVILTREV